MPRFFGNLAAVVLATGFACNFSCWAQQASNKELPLVWVLSTGGTIAGTGASSTNVAEYKGGTILGEDLVKAVPEIKQFANVRVQQIINIRSPDVKLENLLNAIRTAIAPEARGKGVLVVMNDEINGARDVTKTNTYRVETFRSPDFGYLGYVDEDKVSFYRASTKRHTVNSEFDVNNITEFPKVDILYSYVEPNVATIGALLGNGVRRHWCRRLIGFGTGRDEGDFVVALRGETSHRPFQPHGNRPRHGTQGIR